MAMQTVSGTKMCCQCGLDVAGKKRMRDHAGKYWCVNCGEHDRKMKSIKGAGTCAVCGDAASAAALSVVDGVAYCATCLKLRAKGIKGGSANGPNRAVATAAAAGNSSKGMIVAGLIVTGVAALAAVYAFLL